MILGTGTLFKKKICIYFFQNLFYIFNSSQLSCLKITKYAYILETMYLRHKVTIYDLYKIIYELSFWHHA